MPDTESRLYNLHLRAREQQQKRLDTLEPVHDTVSGVVFAINDSIFTERGERYVWVHEWGAYASQQQAYLPPGMSVWEGAGVIIQRAPRPPYHYEIIRISTSPYPGALIDDTEVGRAQYGDHGPNHQYPSESTVGPDPVLIWHSALQLLKSVASTTNLDVTVGPLAYNNGLVRAWFPSQTIDLTSYLPAAGNSVRVLIYLNPATGSIDIVSSDEVVIPGLPDYPLAPYGGISSAFFYLEDTYTTLSMTTDYVDARAFLGGGTFLPVSTSPGQQLFADSSLDFVVGKQVTSGGSVVVSNGDVVWSPI